MSREKFTFPQPGFTVAHTEVAGYPQERWDQGNFLAVRRLRCLWTDRMQLLTELNTEKGRYYPYPTGPWWKDSDDNIIVGAVAVAADIFPTHRERDRILADTELGQVTGHQVTIDDLLTVAVGTYEFVDIIVRYSNNGPVWRGNKTTIRETIEPMAINESVPDRDLRWGSGTGPPVQQSIPFIFYGMEYVATVNLLLEPPAHTLDYVGRCNSNAVGTESMGLVFPAETLLFKPPTITRSATWSGQARWQSTYRFSYHPAGWNTFWRPSTQTYESIYVKNSNTRYVQYPPTTFTF